VLTDAFCICPNKDELSLFFIKRLYIKQKKTQKYPHTKPNQNETQKGEQAIEVNFYIKKASYREGWIFIWYKSA